MRDCTIKMRPVNMAHFFSALVGFLNCVNALI